MEQLSPACIEAVETRHVVSDATELGGLSEWSSFSTLSTTVPLAVPPMLRHPGRRAAGFDSGRYSGNQQVECPVDLLVEEEPDQAGMNQGQGAGADPPQEPERQAHKDMMATHVNQLKYICPELNNIYQYLSINEDWMVCAGHLGLTFGQVGIYQGLLQTRPGILTGQTFLESYMSHNDLTVRRLLLALLSMDREIYNQLARELWTAALLNNSQYYLDLRHNGQI